MTRLQRAVLCFAITVSMARDAVGQASPACFAGRDASGGPALMRLRIERYGELFEIWGDVQTSAFGVFRIKADGWSGAGRMFRGHEYESGALQVRFGNFTGDLVDLQVQGFGSFAFRRVRC